MTAIGTVRKISIGKGFKLALSCSYVLLKENPYVHD